MKVDLIIPKDILPTNGVQRRAFENGARARLDGKLKNCNPYNILRSGGFWTSWAKGWLFADMGDIKVNKMEAQSPDFRHGVKPTKTL